MGLGLGLGLNQQQGGGVDLGVAVQAILSGTAGFALDPIAANLFQDTAGSTPVATIADPVGRFNGQWGSAPPNWQQGIGGGRPAWDGSGIAYDGVATHLNAISNPGILNNAPGAFCCARVLCTDLSAARHIFAFSNGILVGSARFVGLINTNGSIALQSRRLDADAQNTATTAATGLITAGVAAVISWQVDYSGTGLAKIWLNGTEVASAAIAGVLGNSDVTNSLRARLGISLAAVYHSGWIRRIVKTPYVLNDTDRAAMEAWVGAA